MAPRSLTEFAADRPNDGYAIPACCRVPPKLLEQIEADHASDAPHSYAFYSEWLKQDHGLDISSMSFRNHFDSRHPEKRAERG